MNILFQAAQEIQDVLQKRKWPFCFIGGLSVIRWGQIRITQDVDLSLLCGFGHEEKYVTPLLREFHSRISNPEAFALKNRVLLLVASNGVPVDLSLSGLSFEQEMIGRASIFEFAPGLPLYTCSAEDLIVLKAFADRSKDWGDIEGVISRQSRLDSRYIFTQLSPLCDLKEAPDIVKRLQQLLKTSENVDEA